MKLVNICLQLPTQTDNFFRTEAKRRCISKSAVIREVLMGHVTERQSLLCQQTLLEKTPAISR